MQLGNLNTDRRNLIQNQELSLYLVPFDLIHLKYGALDMGFEKINTEILCLFRTTFFLHFSALLFYFQRLVFKQ